MAKPEWLHMAYVIEEVKRRRPTKPNKWHSLLIGKRCALEYLGRGAAAWLWVEGLVEDEDYSHFHTSPVLEVRSVDGHKLVIDTENSVYTLRRIEA